MHDDQAPVLRGELKLTRRDLPVPDLKGDAHLEALVLDLLHVLTGGGGIIAQLVQQPAAVLAHGIVRAAEWGLLIESLVVVADKDTEDVDDAVEEEDREGGIRGGVGDAEATVRVGGADGLALGQGATAKVGLELVRGPVEPTDHPGLPAPEARCGHGLEPVEEGVCVVSWPRGLGGPGGHRGHREC